MNKDINDLQDVADFLGQKIKELEALKEAAPKADMMTFQEAVKHLEEVSDGEYRTLRYEINTNHTGQSTPCCTLYVAERGWHSGTTWEEAFRCMAEANFESTVLEEQQPTEVI